MSTYGVQWCFEAVAAFIIIVRCSPWVGGRLVALSLAFLDVLSFVVVATPILVLSSRSI